VKAWRLVGAAAAPLAEEGPAAADLWAAGATAVWVDGADLVGYYADDAPAPAEAGRWERVDDHDHVAAYLAGLDAVDAGAVVVAPTHRDARLRAGQTVVWLDPGMAFGTGHHETTRLALEGLGRLSLAGRRVLDVGAGSGLLAIAADKLGAADAWGLDVDPDTLPVARANARRNPSRARVVLGGVGVLVANLYAELHAAFLPGYLEVVVPGADLLLTGILDPRDGLVRSALPAGLAVVDERRDGDWWLLHLRAGV